MSRHDIVNNNLVYKTKANETYYIASKQNMPRVGNDAMIRIMSEKDIAYIGQGTIRSIAKQIYTVNIETTKINRLFPEDPQTIHLMYKNDIVQKIEMYDHDGNQIQLHIGLFKLVANQNFLLTPKVTNACKNCKITIGFKSNDTRSMINTVPENLTTLAQRRQKKQNRYQYIPEFDERINSITGGGRCGHTTKAGKACRKRGKCPYH